MPSIIRHLALFILAFAIVPQSVAQKFVHEVVSQNEVPTSAIHKLSKDSWNRLIMITANQAVAYDGQSTYALLDQELIGPLLDVIYVRDQAHHYLLTAEHLYAGFPKWNLPDSMVMIQKWEATLASYLFIEDQLIFQDDKNDVHFYDLKTKQLTDLPYVGGKLRAMYATEDAIYLFGNELYRWNKKNNTYDVLKMDLPPGPIHVFHNDRHPYLITESGQLWKVDLENNVELYLQRIPLVSSVIGGEVIDTKLYIFTRHHGITLVDLNTSKVNYLHSANGLCQNSIRVFLMESDQHIWSIGANDLCLTTNKYPIIADRDLGLLDERMTSISPWNGGLYFSSQATGLYRLKNNNLKYFDSTAGFLDTRVTSLLDLNNESLLIGTSGAGIIEMHRDHTFHYMDSSMLMGQQITCMESTDGQSVFIGTKLRGLWSMEIDSTDAWMFNRLFPTSIKSVVDIVSLINGDFLVVSSNKVFYYEPQNNRLNQLYECNANEQIRDITLWDGWIYAALSNGLVRLPMVGTGKRTERFNAPRNMRSNALQSVHAIDNYIYISDEQGTIKYPAAYFSSLNKSSDIITYPFHILKNGISSIKNEIYAATKKGVILLLHAPLQLNQAKLVLDKISINDIEVDHAIVNFSSDQNRWLVQYAAIAPEYSGTLQYHWSLSGKEHSFSGQTDQRSIYLPYLPSDNYTLTIQGVGDRIKTNTITKKFCIEAPFYKSKLFKLFCILFGFLFLTSFWFIASKMASGRMRKRNAKLKWENEKLEWQQKALQLQMNPHFIFNALNSIQSLVGKDDKQAKYYIAKLGKLMRMTLHHSRAKWILLNEEIDILSTYLDVEKLNRPFTYSINKNTIEENVSIPPMMLQPLVENAVKHGVHKLSASGHIDIVFAYEGRKIKCTVNDNGPGYTEEKKLDENHISVSTRVINERMELYAKEGVKVDPIKIINLNAQGLQGTEVQIGLPYQQTIYEE